MSDILVEGLCSKTNLTRHLDRLRSLATGPVIVELINSTDQAERSYGFYMITSLSIREVLRTLSGDPLRAEVSFELQEVPKWQINANTDRQLTERGDLLIIKDEADLEKATKNGVYIGTTKQDVLDLVAEGETKKLENSDEIAPVKEKFDKRKDNGEFIRLMARGLSETLTTKDIPNGAIQEAIGNMTKSRMEQRDAK